MSGRGRAREQLADRRRDFFMKHREWIQLNERDAAREGVRRGIYLDTHDAILSFAGCRRWGAKR